MEWGWAGWLLERTKEKKSGKFLVPVLLIPSLVRKGERDWEMRGEEGRQIENFLPQGWERGWEKRRKGSEKWKMGDLWAPE